jgi:hypothetical protein
MKPDRREAARPAIVEELCDRSMVIEVVDDGARDDHRHRNVGEVVGPRDVLA